MVKCWGLGYHDNARTAENFLRAFDRRVEEAGTDGFVHVDKFQAGFNVIFGLHRFGMEMIVSQGDSAIGDIMSVSALMKEIGAVWRFEPELLNDLTAGLEAKVWELLPNQRVTGRTEQGYEIKQVTAFSNGRGFALAGYSYGRGFTTAENPDRPQPFAVWQFKWDDRKTDFHWLIFTGEEAGALKAYQSYATNYAAKRDLEPVMMSDGWLIGKEESPSNIEARIVNRSKAPDIRTGERLSVLKRIRAAKAAPKEVKEQPPRQKSKGGPER